VDQQDEYDEIIQEVWLVKDAIAAKYNHNVTAMANALRDREQRSSATVVNLHNRRQANARAAKQ
jgi:hypothetical protein